MISFKKNVSTKIDIIDLLKKNNYKPGIENKTSFNQYIDKIFNKAEIFEAWNNKIFVAFLAIYFNNLKEKIGYLTYLAVDSKFTNKGIAKKLLKKAFNYGKNKGFIFVDLEVNKENQIASNIYFKLGFKNKKIKDNKILLRKQLI